MVFNKGQRPAGSARGEQQWKTSYRNPLDSESNMNDEWKIKQIETRPPLKEYPDPILRRTALPVADVCKSVRALLRGMARIMYNREGIGLAAPQIGVMKRLIIADIGEGLLSLINPEILDRRGEAFLLEGCLSLPNVGVKVTRNESIVVRGIDTAGREVTRDLSGLMARVIQHEIDHLNGVLILDYGPTENLHELKMLPQELQCDRKIRL